MSELNFTDNFHVEDLGIIEDYVYDIEVENNHNFFGNDICVHNSTYFVLDQIVKQKFPDDSDKIKVTRWLDKFCEEIIGPIINKAIQELHEHMHAYEPALSMKRENIADRAIVVAGKNYLMNVWNSEGIEYKEPHIKIVGLSAIKSSTPAVCRKAIKDSIKIIIGGTEKELQQYVRDFKKEFVTYDFTTVAFPKGISEMDKYTNGTAKTLPIHARASLVYNKLVKEHNIGSQYEYIGNGDKIKMCYMLMPNPTGQNVMACLNELPSVFGLDKYIDYETQFEKAFVNQVAIITKCIGWSPEPRATLESFFGG